MQFKDVITDPAQFRELMGDPPPPCVAKTIAILDRHCRAFIARSPFVLIASASARQQMDISPKGDAPPCKRSSRRTKQNASIRSTCSRDRQDLLKWPDRRPVIDALSQLHPRRGIVRGNPACAIIKCSTARKRLILKTERCPSGLRSTLGNRFHQRVLTHIKAHQRTPDQRLPATSICVDVSPLVTVFDRGFGGHVTQF